MLKKLLLISIISIGSIVGCNQVKHHIESRVQIHEYKTQNSNGDLLFWYLVFGSNNQYYSHYSSFPIHDFGKVNFTESSKIPIQLENSQEEKIEEVNTKNFPDEIENSVVTEQVEIFDENMDSNDGWGDHSSESNQGSESGESGSSDGGSSDGGGSSGGE